MTAVLYDEVVAATSAPRLRVVPDPTPTALPGADPLVEGAARLLCVPLRQLYAALWRVGVLEVGA
jgi:hypothetical protein